MSEYPKQAASEALVRLMELIARLRAPGGCPWDRAQTTESVAGYLLEEGFEAVEAIESHDVEGACGELGDLLFQVVFMAQLYAEAQQFDLADVIDKVHEKMISRHPHVFGDTQAKDPEQVRRLWGRLKEKERGENAQGLLQSVPATAPALLQAHRLGQRASTVGFDWKRSEDVWQKVLEEMDELAQAPDKAETQAELGDLLFAWAQWARHRGLDAEAALRRANRRFTRRFGQMETLAAKRGQNLAGLTPEELDALWEEVKAAEQKSPTDA